MDREIDVCIYICVLLHVFTYTYTEIYAPVYCVLCDLGRYQAYIHTCVICVDACTTVYT